MDLDIEQPTAMNRITRINEQRYETKNGLTQSALRPPLNTKLFPVHRRTGLKRADWNNNFFSLPPCTILFVKNEIRKKKIPNSRLAVFLPTWPTGNNLLLKGGLKSRSPWD